MLQYVHSALTAGLLLLVFWQARLLRLRARTNDSALGALTKSIENTDTAQGLLTELQRRLQENIEWGERQHRRAEEYFSIFQVIENERDLWQKLYHQSSLQAGNAQAWLLRELQRIALEGNQAVQELRKVKPALRAIEVDPRLEAALDEFRTTHPGGHTVARAPDPPRELPDDPRPAS